VGAAACAGADRRAQRVRVRSGPGRRLSTVELRGFGWRHAGRKAWAVRDVDLRVEHGERVLLLGPSGAGKSTLLAAIGGLLAPDTGEQAGEILVDGVPARAARAGTGVVFQDPETQIIMARCGDDVAFGLESAGVPAGAIRPRVEASLAAVGFDHPLDHDTAALSGGEKQRLALAGALAPEPGLLLLDEPTANLDPSGAALVREALGRIAGRTMILVEHRVAEVLPLVDRVVVLADGGGLLADGTPEKVFGWQSPSQGPAARGRARLRLNGSAAQTCSAELAAQGVWVPDLTLAPRRAHGPAGAALLVGRGLAFRHRGASRDALSPVDVTVHAGQALAVLGRNGAGKSTLARVLGGLARPTAGSLAAPGFDGPPWTWRAAALASRIGSVFQEPEHQFVTQRVRDELAFGGVPKSTVDDLLDRLRLARLALANPYTLSGGQQRRLSVATALAKAPRTLVLDEPTFGQDLRTWRELVDIIADLRDDGHGVVVVTHDPDLVATLADVRLVL
jgi:energy-coupling factor transport system ATP-binding protein